jgi:hypothetical protein
MLGDAALMLQRNETFSTGVPSLGERRKVAYVSVSSRLHDRVHFDVAIDLSIKLSL